jgi:hypothetical protein
MKNSITEYVIAVFELLEAEVSSLNRGITKLITRTILFVMAAFLGFIAFIFLAMGLQDYYLTFMTSYLASFATAGSFILLSFLLLLVVKWRQ